MPHSESRGELGTDGSEGGRQPARKRSILSSAALNGEGGSAPASTLLAALSNEEGGLRSLRKKRSSSSAMWGTSLTSSLSELVRLGWACTGGSKVEGSGTHAS